MSWLDAIEDDVEIEMGDGQIFHLGWKGASIVQEFNVTEFDFSNVEGTLVKRKKPRGAKYSFEGYYSGENHLEQSERFRESAKHSGYWRLKIPYYPEVTVQPTRLRFDNEDLNVSKITGLLIETIIGASPVGQESPADNITNQQVELNELSAVGFEENTLGIQPPEALVIDQNLSTVLSTNEPLIKDEFSLNELRNRVNEGHRAIRNVASEASTAMRKIQSAINYPFQVISDIRATFSNLKDQFIKIVDSVDTILSRNTKVYIETMGATVVAGTAAASISQIEDTPYESREEVSDVIVKVLEMYELYVLEVEKIETESHTELESYSPNPDVLRAVQNIVFLTISKLEEIALNSQQEHIVILDRDSNCISISAKYYGVDKNDEKLDRFIRTNKIGLNELLNLRKGREIIYYT